MGSLVGWLIAQVIHYISLFLNLCSGFLQWFLVCGLLRSGLGDILFMFLLRCIYSNCYAISRLARIGNLATSNIRNLGF